MASRADKQLWRSVGVRIVALDVKWRAKRLTAIKRAAEAVLKAGEPRDSTLEHASRIAKRAHKLIELCEIMPPHDALALNIVADFWAEKEMREQRELRPLDCWRFALQIRNVLAGNAGAAWEAQVLDALGQNPNLTLAEAAKIGGVFKSTISRHLFLGRIWKRNKSIRTSDSQLYDHDGATEDPDPSD